MADPFLLAHQAGPRVFNLAGRLSPISIRDQMLRAYLFVERAREQKLVTTDSAKGLLIIGGGACAASAALLAVDCGIPTVVLERSKYLIKTQIKCSTRFLDPTQYDWPLDHWDTNRFPARGVAMPIPWKGDWARQLGIDWADALNDAVFKNPGLLTVKVRSRAKVHAASPKAKTIFADLVTPSGTHASQPFGAVLVTVGFGREKIQAPPNYRGYAFWEPDPFQKPNWGVGHPHQPRILISGAGDGALQDFLRITTGKNSAAEVLAACGVPSDIAAALKDIDRQVAAQLAWGSRTQHDHALHIELDTTYKQKIASLLADPVVLYNLQHLLKNAPLSLQLTHGCSHLTAYYGLNRFLTLLILEFLRRKGPTTVHRPNSCIVSVTGIAHFCASNPSQCHGQAHRVEFGHWSNCATKPPTVSGNHDEFDIVIIRHGPTPFNRLVSSLTPHAQPRQVLPHYLL